MCGLVGCLGNISAKEEEIFRNMLVFDTLRGPHSTGVLAINGGFSPSISKTVGDPFQLFDTSSFSKIMKQKNLLLIGHNRFATTGQINRKNAHPFECDQVIGAHNGTLTNKFSLKNGNHFEVDSQALFDHIAISGLKDALSVARGAYALTYYDKDEKTFNMVRNKERPLFYTFNEKKTCLFWASEKWMLSVALSRSDIKYTEIVDLEPLSWLSFPVVNGIKELIPTITPITELPKEYETFHNHNRPFRRSQEHNKFTPPKTKSLLSNEFDRVFFNSEHKFHVGISAKDKDGALYVNLFDELNPLYDVRYYVHKTNKLHDRIGEFINAYIGGAGKSSEGVYIYRLDPDTIKYINAEKQQTVKDEMGNTYTKDEFNKEFDSCIWCASPLMFEDDNRLTGKGVGVCPSCKENPEVTMYI